MTVEHRHRSSSGQTSPTDGTRDLFQWVSSAHTHPGVERQLNEDSWLGRSDIALWAVADGMGGHARGEMASAMVVESLRRLEPPTAMSTFVDAVEDRILDVHVQLRKYAAEHDLKTIGTTVAALLVFDRLGVCLWAGDSRLYRFRQNRLEQLTRDHALVEDLVNAGLVKRAEAEHHPHAHLVTRAVGATERLCLDIDAFKVRNGDVFLLCSDGLNKEVPESLITKALQQYGAEKASEVLVEIALSRGARDNVTAVTVQAVATEKLPAV